VRYFEKHLKSCRGNIRRPERETACPKDARIDYCVDVGAVTLAIEHTLIEAFPSQIKDGIQFAAFAEPIQDAFKTGLPGNYGLTLEIGSLAGLSKQKIPEIREAVIEWIRREAPLLSAPPNHFICARPEGVPFKVSLHKHKASWRKECLVAMRAAPVDLETRRTERLRCALKRKQPKLRIWEEQGAKSVLVLECGDIALSNEIEIKDALAKVVAFPGELPNYVILVDTCAFSWGVFMLVSDRQLNTQSQNDFEEFHRNDLCEL
jgi:hypothetical protein